MNVNISEEIYQYLGMAFPNSLGEKVEAFSLMEAFDLEPQEEDYLNIIYDNSIDPLVQPDLVNAKIQERLKSILVAHGIQVNETTEGVQTSDLNIVVDFLKKVQELEDYSIVSRWLTYSADARFTIINLLVSMKLMAFSRACNLIEDVDPLLLERLRVFAKDEYPVNLEDKSLKRHLTTSFLKYINDEKSLGHSLYTDGYSNLLKYQDLVKILPFDLQTLFAKDLTNGKVAKVALDLLSLMMITSDAREEPIRFFTENSDLLFDDADTARDVFEKFKWIYTDFKAYKDAVDKGLNNENSN